ncbi:undecaprenyldiphospho-muramoylpentapeptide beta-N-acetylglucosaminyltransferase [Oharaeibacter diazotrophicus]|uniref:UDP-N-acetylglucosamine--N-acetylmuramyl-(pentapeptide) pyrophosphoryl-undecaprenol N-acetylglucosamine transferase n=1 Tax=Oharaeibacter diazotrophicus TaxID=1920512 RepID=A0A4R6RH99_9HYPH|nr:undecaprenyldiphospho-muramoylpentapeptide beta-N-acetylglucosaminyltransferase [Oharaeibacter diazotrophicus]TDP85535.1 UDP-N-acetylglucosamine-N-acetylmuramylpentapeptide N-acetylglucosamine transferase [Oharaeibacter diazotrophicus]BBE74506.1 UDP-N-acetylglucosamine-N-acetylmuramyl-(pentapeptide) pyrophosphoryl-undecaprenol N-acetylglucosamine transferase [Pleomorphomonas sp. SM30]GLS75795.1 UDP-N-acetylglucosamine--N-acetylmuramyl-(pentapeptide) pyrophosphoryl-undecaprenol N-acetylglucosa
MGSTFLIAAGGTGGHLFPAEALAHELGRRGHVVHLATDHRATDYGRDFPAAAVHVVASATFGDRSPLGLARSAVRIATGQLQSLALVGRLKPAAAIGFGGYPTLPPLLAASLRGVPTVVHEANAVMGRANRFLARRTTAVATSFATTRLLDDPAKAVTTGNPVRPRVVAAASPYDVPAAAGPFRLVVFGGSQGARVFSELVPPALALLAPDLGARLRLVQQVRPEDMARVRAGYSELGIEAELLSFFPDLPERIAGAHLVVCRSGASSVSELAVIGRPSILVPLPHALDADQKSNALELERAGGALMAEQASLTPDVLAGHLSTLMNDPGRLAAMATAARGEGRPDAVQRLADLVEHVGAGGRPADFARGRPTP